MQLSDIATRQLITVSPSDSLDKAISLMDEHEIHHLPVLDENVPVGMISDRDLLMSVGWLLQKDRIDLRHGDVLGPRTVGEVMSSPIKTLPIDATIAHGAQALLDERFSAVLLTKADAPAGLVSESDFLHCFTDERPIGNGSKWRFTKAVDHMTTSVKSGRSNDTLYAAAKHLRDHHIRHLPIVHNGRVIGIVSDRDIHRGITNEWIEHERGNWDIDEDDEDERNPRHCVRSIMSKRVETIDPHTTLSDAADRMINLRIGSLPVTENQELVGVLTETDLMQALEAALLSAGSTDRLISS